MLNTPQVYMLKMNEACLIFMTRGSTSMREMCRIVRSCCVYLCLYASFQCLISRYAQAC